jgi:hypothetical protein
VRQGPVRPSWGEPWVGERWWWDEVGARFSDDERVGKRRQYDDPSVGPSHALPTGASEEFEDFCRQLEVVLQGVPEGKWTQIQDEGVLEKCVGLPTELWTLIRRAAIAGAVMIGRLPPGLEGPLASGAPPPERGPDGGAIEAP